MMLRLPTVDRWRAVLSFRQGLAVVLLFYFSHKLDVNLGKPCYWSRFYQVFIANMFLYYFKYKTTLQRFKFSSVLFYTFEDDAIRSVINCRCRWMHESESMCNGTLYQCVWRILLPQRRQHQ